MFSMTPTTVAAWPAPTMRATIVQLSLRGAEPKINTPRADLRAHLALLGAATLIVLALALRFAHRLGGAISGIDRAATSAASTSGVKVAVRVKVSPTARASGSRES